MRGKIAVALLVSFFSVNSAGAETLIDYKVMENSRAIDEMSKVIYKLAQKVVKLEKENRTLKEKVEAIEKRVNGGETSVSRNGFDKGAVEKRPRIAKVLRLVSVFKGTNTAPVIRGLKLIEKETGVPLFAGIGERYFVVYTTKPVPKEILREAGFSDAYWESSRKAIYQKYRKISPDDVGDILRSLGKSGQSGKSVVRSEIPDL